MTLREVLKDAGIDPPEAILDVELATRTDLGAAAVMINGSFSYGPGADAATEVTMTLQNWSRT